MSSGANIRRAFTTARPARALLLFAAVLLGFLYVQTPLLPAVFQAAPMLLIAAAGFCINDVFDQEQDRINHPERALSEYPALSHLVTTTYIFLFVGSILIIAIQPLPLVKFLWSLLFIALSNYSFIKRNFPSLKNVYIALSSTVPLAIIDFTSDGLFSSPWLFGPLALAVFARELACDVPDISGDDATIAVRLGEGTSSGLVFACYAVSLSLLTILSNSERQFMIAAVGWGLLTLYSVFKSKYRWSERRLILFSAPLVICPAVLVLN